MFGIFDDLLLDGYIEDFVYPENEAAAPEVNEPEAEKQARNYLFKFYVKLWLKMPSSI